MFSNSYRWQSKAAGVLLGVLLTVTDGVTDLEGVLVGVTDVEGVLVGDTAGGVLEGVGEVAVHVVPLSSISTLKSKPPAVSGKVPDSAHTVVLAPPAREKEVAEPPQGV